MKTPNVIDLKTLNKYLIFDKEVNHFRWKIPRKGIVLNDIAGHKNCYGYWIV